MRKLSIFVLALLGLASCAQSEREDVSLEKGDAIEVTLKTTKTDSNKYEVVVVSNVWEKNRIVGTSTDTLTKGSVTKKPIFVSVVDSEKKKGGK